MAMQSDTGSAVSSADVPTRVEIAAHAAQPEADTLWRDRFAALLLAVFLVSSAVGVVAIWARAEVLDTDRFVRTVAPLSENEDVQIAISNRVADELITAIQRDPESVGVVGELTGPAARAALQSVISQATLRLVSSSSFSTVWENVARASHGSVVLLVEGNDGNLLVTEGGEVAFDLTPVVAEISDTLAAQGIDLFSGTPVQDAGLSLVVFQSEELAQAQRFVGLLDTLATILPIVSLLSLLGYLLASSDRWSAGIHASFGFGLSMVVVLLFLLLARWVYLRNLDPDIDKDVARAVFDTLLHFLRRWLRLLAIAGVVLAGVLLLLRPRPDERSGTIRSVREQLTWNHQTLVDHVPAVGTVESAVVRHRAQAIGFFLGATVLVFLLWDSLSPIGNLALVLVAVIGSVTIWFAPSRSTASIPTTSS